MPVHRLRPIDFNTATVHGSYACEPGIRQTAQPPRLSKSFTPTEDSGALRVLDALHRINTTLVTYRMTLGQWGRCGLCRLGAEWSLPWEQADPPTRPLAAQAGPQGAVPLAALPLVALPPASASVDGSPEEPPDFASGAQRGRDECEQSNVSSGLFWMMRQGAQPGGPPPVLPRTGAVDAPMRLPAQPTRLPTLSDVHSCVEQCQACSRCAAISVSSERHVCAWFASRQSGRAPPCDAVLADSPSLLRTARMVRQQVTHLDDVVTFLRRE